MAPNLDDLAKTAQAAAKRQAQAMASARQVAAAVAATRPKPPAAYAAGAQAAGTPKGGQQ